MQKILFLMFMTIWGRLAQQTLLSEGVGIDVPKDAKRLSKEQAIAHVDKRFNKNKIILNAVSTRNADYEYKIDDVLVSLSSDNKSVKEGHLSELKQGFDEMFVHIKIKPQLTPEW